MKRNKCLDKAALRDLSPLTIRILARMGAQGAEIRRRLTHLFEGRHGLSRKASSRQL